jgi:asparagine synthase (glutamine-hydrolysing)
MCGICGFIQSRPLAFGAQDLVERMRDQLVHRGPDGCGTRVGADYALAHRRLSIIDLSEHGRQPMSNEDGTVWVTFNGEIYNHQEIRAQLQTAGHVFSSRCDTEVLVHGWEEWGEDVLERLNGMFAFVVVDERARCTFVARDRLGIKPLYYFLTDEVFGFASEVKALLEHPACPIGVNTDVLGEHLMFRNVAGPRTLFKGISQLSPGSYCTVDEGLRLRMKHYWRPQLPGAAEEDMTSDEFLDRLRSSVQRRMMSDVPLGIQLSGGLDSSVVTRLGADDSPFQMKTFSIGFSENAYNEFPHSQRVAEYVGTDHLPILVRDTDFDRELDQLVWLMDTPIDHPNSIFLHLLCRRAKEDVTVLLAGEGADELLAGYARYAFFDRMAQRTAALPSVLKSMIRGVPAGWSPARFKMVKDWLSHGWSWMAIRNSAFGRPELLGMLSDDVPIDLSVREAIITRHEDGAPADALLRLDQECYLVSVLQRQDRVSMGASVEARVPFLDHTLVEAANRVRLGKKLFAGSGKHILKQAAAGIIPSEIIERPKMGFPIPIREWLRHGGGLSPRLDLLLSRSCKIATYFDSAQVGQMVDEHREGRRDHSEALWILLTLEMWTRKFLNGAGQRPASIPELCR